MSVNIPKTIDRQAYEQTVPLSCVRAKQNMLSNMTAWCYFSRAYFGKMFQPNTNSDSEVNILEVIRHKYGITKCYSKI